MARVAATVSPRPQLRLVTARDKRARAALKTSNRGLIVSLLAAALLLSATGLIMVLSASSVTAFAQTGSGFSFFQRQFMYGLVGIVGMIAAARLHHTVWRKIAFPFFGITILLLVLVLHPTAGHSAGGSSRWIELGPITIQPSEIAKLSVVAFAAAVLTKKWKKLDEPSHLLLPLLPAVGVVCLLVMLQPDLGTTVVIAGMVFILLFAAGVRLRYLFTGALVGGALGFALIMSASYRRERLLSFLDPWSDPKNSGYQVIQSMIGLASGGLTGVGLGASRQKWGYLPNGHTDFIFSILGEELGLIGAVAVLFLFGVLLFTGVRIASRTPDVFGRLLGAGIVGWLGLQTIINLGAVTGLLPVTGVPLPFVSYGGSSLVVSLTAVGILISIARAGPKGGGRAVPKAQNAAERRSR